MKHAIFLLFLLLGLSLTGCSSLYPDEYVTVAAHVAPYAHKQLAPDASESADAGKPMSSASCANEIREIIQNMVREGKETEQILLVNYEGNIEEDLRNMVNFMREDSPKYVYAMHSDSFVSDLRRTDVGTIVTVNLKLRLTAQEVQAIDTELFPEPAMARLYAALSQHLSSFTMQVSGYQDTDFFKVLDDYILHNPDQVVEVPGISVTVYPPDRGNVRVLDFHFDYNDNTPEILKAHQEDTSSLLNASLNLLSDVQTPQKTVETLYKLLVPPYGYKTVSEATSYSLVVAKAGGSSRIMASVAEYLCKKAGWNCEIVIGSYQGELWYLNRILENNQWLYFDLHAAGLSGCPPILRTAAQMQQFYTWDVQQYPEQYSPEDEQDPTAAPLPPQDFAVPPKVPAGRDREREQPAETGWPTESEQPTEPVEVEESGKTTEPERPHKPEETAAQADSAEPSETETETRADEFEENLP